MQLGRQSTGDWCEQRKTLIEQRQTELQGVFCIERLKLHVPLLLACAH